MRNVNEFVDSLLESARYDIIDKDGSVIITDDNIDDVLDDLTKSLNQLSHDLNNRKESNFSNITIQRTSVPRDNTETAIEKELNAKINRLQNEIKEAEKSKSNTKKKNIAYRVIHWIKKHPKKSLGIGLATAAAVGGSIYAAKKIRDKRKEEKENINEFVDNLINAKRYEIINELSTNFHIKDKSGMNFTNSDKFNNWINKMYDIWFNKLFLSFINRNRKNIDEKYKDTKIDYKEIVKHIKIENMYIMKKSNYYDRNNDKTEDVYIFQVYYTFTKYFTKFTKDQSIILQVIFTCNNVDGPYRAIKVTEETS